MPTFIGYGARDSRKSRADIPTRACARPRPASSYMLIEMRRERGTPLMAGRSAAQLVDIRLVEEKRIDDSLFQDYARIHERIDRALDRRPDPWTRRTRREPGISSSFFSRPRLRRAFPTSASRSSCAAVSATSAPSSPPSPGSRSRRPGGAPTKSSSREAGTAPSSSFRPRRPRRRASKRSPDPRNRRLRAREKTRPRSSPSARVRR